MAEALALAAGIFACVAIVGSITKDTTSLCRSVQRIKVAKREIEIFRKHVQDYGNVIGLACTALRPFEHLSDDDNSLVVRYMLENDVWVSMVTQCECIKEDIRKHVIEIRGLRKRSQLMAKLKWMLQRREIEALGPRMESVKSSLLLVIASIQLELLRLQPRTESSDMEIKRLKRQIKEHVKTIDEWKEKLETTGNSVADRESAEKFASLIQNVQSALQELGESMVYDRRVPGHPPPLTSPTASSISTKSRGHRSSTFANTSASTFPTSQRNRSNRILPLQPFHVAPLQTQHPKQQRQEQQRQEQQRPVHPIVPPIALEPEGDPSSSGRNHNNNYLPRNVAPQRPRHLERLIQFPRSGSEVVFGHEKTGFTDYDPDQLWSKYQAEAGYISTPTGPLSTNARLYQNLSENLVTQAFVAEQKLDNVELFDMDDLADEDEMWIQIGKGQREKCVGRVELLWSKGAEHGSAEFPVTCWICVHSVANLVFGRRFVDSENDCVARRRGSRHGVV